MSLSSHCLSEDPLAAIHIQEKPRTKVPPSRRTVAKADDPGAPEQR